jgi:hypothetical protein
LIGLTVLVAAAVAAAGLGAAWVLGVYDSAPALDEPRPLRQDAVSTVYAADGFRLGVIHFDTVREPVSADRVARALKQATVGSKTGASTGRAASRRRRSSALPGGTCSPAASRCRAARRSRSKWSASPYARALAAARPSGDSWSRPAQTETRSSNRKGWSFVSDAAHVRELRVAVTAPDYDEALAFTAMSSDCASARRSRPRMVA